MKKKKFVVAFILLIIFCIAIRLYIDNSSIDLPGSVIGPNPDNIPERELPRCNFTGVEFVKEPCYSPPGSVYL